MKQRLKTYFSQPTANGQGKALNHQLMLEELSQQLLQTSACFVSSLQRLQDLHNSFAKSCWRSSSIQKSHLHFVELTLSTQFLLTKQGGAACLLNNK